MDGIVGQAKPLPRLQNKNVIYVFRNTFELYIHFDLIDSDAIFELLFIFVPTNMTFIDSNVKSCLPALISCV